MSTQSPDETAEPPRPWWQGCVAYQIYPRSFCDTTGNGVGDLAGVRAHLDHLVWLGVDAIWLSPFFRSPMADYGYDVSDYCDVDPLFGDLEEFDRLLSDAHARGLRVVIDWVPNHTSDQHPWFVDARASRDAAHRNWYIWRDPPADGSLPNNWMEALTFGPAWTFDEHTGQHYLHNFFSSQPDLNWDNPDVVDAMLGTLRFWLDRGVDGFRMDVVNLIGKDPQLPDDPPEIAGLPHLIINDTPQTHEHLKHIRRLLDSYPDDRMAIGEVILMGIDEIVTHLGDDADELHLAFNFPPMHQPWDAEQWRRSIEKTEDVYSSIGGWPTWVLSNHDAPRHRTRYGGSEAIARAAAVLLLTLRGTVFLYAGEELGLEDATVGTDRQHDPGGRDGCRAPIPWTAHHAHGWAADPWLPWPPEAPERNVVSLTAADDSILHLYRRLLELRRSSSVLQHGALEMVESDPEVVAYRRTGPEGDIIVAINFSDSPAPLPPDISPTDITLSSLPLVRPAKGLRPFEAVVSTG